jgi:hypothetical protein
MPRRRRWIWLIVAALLFAAGALLMGLHDAPPAPPPQVKLPRYMDRAASERQNRRRTLPRFRAAPAEGEAGPLKPARLRDPLLAALPPTVKKAAVIVEANALRHSPVGELFVDCLTQREGAGLDRFRRMSGVDPLKDLDRVAYVDDTVILSGHFAEARWSELLEGRTPETRDSRATIYAGRGEHVAVWNGQMVIVGRSRDAVTGVLDRLEGRTPPADPVISESDTYGEIYGLVTGAAVAEALGPEQAALAERLRSVASRIMLHVDASRDVGIVADVAGARPDETQNFARALGAALALARFQAIGEGHKDIAAALEHARVNPTDGPHFRAELGLPLELFKARLKDCARRGRPRGRPDAAPRP